MPHNLVLFEKYGVSWTVAKCLVVAGTLSLVLCAVLFTILFKHLKGTVRRLEPGEAGRVAFYGRSTATPGLDEVIQADGAGVGVELKFGIDDLRQAARRGDWKTFWLSPVMMTCGALGFCFLMSAGLLAARVPAFAHVLVDVMVLFLIFMTWFSCWAAIYTNIDAGTARATPTAGGGAPRSGGGAGGRR